ncbi:MAG: hypothetical protein JWO90_2785, partial [Solirubrobacterales bacterium]|nr:hypothetical protein [Solirubrobacterales bacterium]
MSPSAPTTKAASRNGSTNGRADGTRPSEPAPAAA